MSGVIGACAMAGRITTERGRVVTCPYILSTGVARIIYRWSVHVDLAIPVVTDRICSLIEGRIICRWIEFSTAAGSGLLDTVTSGAGVMAGDNTDIFMIYRLAAFDNNFDVSRPIRRESMALGTVQRKSHGLRVTVLATDRGRSPTDTVKSHSMTERTGLLDVAGGIMKGVIGPGPVNGVGSLEGMASLTTVRQIAQRDIKARVASRASCRLVGMTLLALRQVGLGLFTVSARRSPIRTQRVIGRTRTTRMAGRYIAVDPRSVGIVMFTGETAWRGRYRSAPRPINLVTESAAGILSGLLNTAMAGIISRILNISSRPVIIIALPVGRVRPGMFVTVGAITIHAEVVSPDRRAGGHSTIHIVGRRTMAVQTIILT
ncbi:hypothetical protein C2E25_09160 [Geothermobacter hydrogeniphilus]|uniref:Uncharacterized protein n=1 Tax=Geothermobacter hydrogeniphilus TaxID=1969733 RepID=A0A2K2H9T5_9BACT|nr:hypothetical protein C2E25_09160 [Geothermobacter hydrogeniphilus]